MLLQPTGLAQSYHWDAFGDSGWGGRLAPTTATPLATVGGAGRLADWRLAPTTATPLAPARRPQPRPGISRLCQLCLCSQSLSYVVGVGCVNMTYVLVQAPPGMPEPKRVPVPEPKYPPKRGVVTVDKSPSYSSESSEPEKRDKPDKTAKTKTPATETAAVPPPPPSPARPAESSEDEDRWSQRELQTRKPRHREGRRERGRSRSGRSHKDRARRQRPWQR